MTNRRIALITVRLFTLIASAIFASANAIAAEPTQEQLDWGKCTWKVAAKYGQTELYYRMVFTKEREEGDYLKWEDFDIRMVVPICGDMPGIWSGAGINSYDVLKATYPGSATP